MTEPHTLRQAAERALDEHQAALAAAQAAAERFRMEAAAKYATDAVERLTGGVPLMVRAINLTGTAGFEAEVEADDVTLAVEQYDDGTTNIGLLAPCPNCRVLRRYGEWITHLHELGQALRDADQPCHACQRPAPDSIVADDPLMDREGNPLAPLHVDDDLDVLLRSWS